MYIYLLQEREDMRDNNGVYKIGRSGGDDLSRLRSYGSGTDYITHMKVNDCVNAEQELIETFSINFTLTRGREYFYIEDIDNAIDLFVAVARKFRCRPQRVAHPNSRPLVRPQRQPSDTTENNAKFTCELCKYETQWKQNLTKHLKSSKHANNLAKIEKEAYEAKEQRKHFVCTKCSKRFSKQQGLTRHVNRKSPCVSTV